MTLGRVWTHMALPNPASFGRGPWTTQDRLYTASLHPRPGRDAEAVAIMLVPVYAQVYACWATRAGTSVCMLVRACWCVRACVGGSACLVRERERETGQR